MIFARLKGDGLQNRLVLLHPISDARRMPSANGYLRYGETGAPVNPNSAYLTMKALFRRAGLYSASK